MKQPNKIEDEEMSELFLSKLLQYRSQLVDHDFIKKIMKEIDQFHSIRQFIILGCSVIGIFSLIGALSLDWMLEFDLASSQLVGELSSVPTESVSIMVVASVMILGFWLVVSDQ